MCFGCEKDINLGGLGGTLWTEFTSKIHVEALACNVTDFGQRALKR